MSRDNKLIVGMAVLVVALVLGLLPFSVRNGVSCGPALLGSKSYSEDLALGGGPSRGTVVNDLLTGICRADKGDTRVILALVLGAGGSGLITSARRDTATANQSAR